MATATPSYHSATDTADLTITLASLATSASMVAGRESTVVDNTSNKYTDVLVTGQITTGTTPTTQKTIGIFVYTPIDLNSSTDVYPVATTTALTGSDAAATFEIEQRLSLKQGFAIIVNATSDRKYSFAFNVAALYGGLMPRKWGIFVTHDTGVNLNATAGNHWITYMGYKYDIA